MSSRRQEKLDRRSRYEHRSNEAPSLHMPRPTILGKRLMPEGIYAEAWSNNYYRGHIRRYDHGCPIGNGPYAVLSLTATDETARHDWREFQQIKNYLVGKDWEALELYPAESRLQDPSNCFYLWCMPAGIIQWGGIERTIKHPREAIAPQRAFPSLSQSQE
jgi:hypothetical protein